MRDGRWLYHRGLSGLEVSAEDRLFIPGEMFKWDFGKAQLAALTFFDAHHLPPANIDDFDEERERARLVAV